MLWQHPDYRKPVWRLYPNFRFPGGQAKRQRQARQILWHLPHWRRGGTEIAGLLNAETITILAEGSSEIGDIGCTTVTVSRRQQGQGLLAQLFSRAIGGLTVGTIEGDEIRLEHTKAKVGRGKQVVIGPGCEIDRVEYTESCQAEAGTVAESIKL